MDNLKKNKPTVTRSSTKAGVTASKSKDIAKILLQINAIKLNPANPYTWVSGKRAPIYCDNRRILSYEKERNKIVKGFVSLIKEKYPDVEVIAGVATGAIAHGMLVAYKLKKPFIYVRSEAKGHGLKNLIEGEYHRGQKVVVIEDLISTGRSSLAAVSALKEEGLEVEGMAAIFTYGFEEASKNFANENVKLDTLSDYAELVSIAEKQKKINSEDVEILRKWREDPANC